MQQNVLLIDDDKKLCGMLTEYLDDHGYAVTAVHRGDTGLTAALHGSWDLVLVDVMLPGLDGFEIVRQLRANSTVRVLLLTARGDEVDRIVGLELGADDYLPKPFNVRELVARMRAILRRPMGQTLAKSNCLAIRKLTLELSERTVSFDRKKISLTDVEYRIVECLMQNAGTSITRETLTKHSHGRSLRPFDRSLDMHVSRLRRKLEAAGMATDQLRTVRGEGYLLVNPSGARL